MANQEHLNVLKQGAERWNQWRKEHPHIILDLSVVDLSSIDLSGADLSFAQLFRANLSGANLSRANLSGANFSNEYIFLRGAPVDPRWGQSGESDFQEVQRFRSFPFTGANLSRANLSGASLEYANLTEADLRGADLIRAYAGYTVFGAIDLSNVKGLETVNHSGPSTIGVDTIFRSQGQIPEAFLRGAGVPETFFISMRALFTSMRPIDFYSCFISYSSKDQAFADRLYVDLQNKRVRCWFAPEDLKIGDHYHQRIDESIHLYDKLILILSEHAVQSAWVEREVVAAREKEDHEQRPVLFPICLDEAVMSTTKAWAADVRRRWHIGDFTQWKDHDAYQQAFERLLRDLKAETRK